MKPNTLILRSAGTNCDVELAHAFELAGSSTEAVHLNALVDVTDTLERFDILGLPGGFSFGDDISAGRILANRIRHRLMPALRQFVAAGKPIIGICNGFQVLVKTGLLPDFDPASDDLPRQTVTLADNTLPRFVDRWVGLEANPQSPCIWTKGIESITLPIAHGEGRLVASGDELDRLEADGRIALRYTGENPNGSMRDIAGLCDATGLVFGLMPHPERYTHPRNHPDFPGAGEQTLGLRLFQNAVEHVTAQTVA